ncbi:MAG: YraN family protein [Burkholderiaceae bacterium]
MPRLSPTQRRGREAEQRAQAFLVARGLSPVTCNASSRLGELDLVMRDRDEWVFVEVRQRRRIDFGGAAASVDAAKQARVRRAAQVFLLGRFGQRPWPACRFDVVAFDGDACRWIRSAF